MQALINPAAQPLTMSSREIAGLTGGHRFNVRATVNGVIR